MSFGADKNTDHLMSYAEQQRLLRDKVLKRTKCESVETTIAAQKGGKWYRGSSNQPNGSWIGGTGRRRRGASCVNVGAVEGKGARGGSRRDTAVYMHESQKETEGCV